MNEHFLSVKNLRVEYRTDLETVKAVNGISFDLDRGETLGIVGETGAGKTSVALALLRLLPELTGYIEGDILLEGRDVSTIPIKEMRDIRGKKIAMIFQDPMTALNPVMTVGKQIGEAIRLHNSGISVKKLEERVDEVLTLVGIAPERKRDYPHQFSGGMKQRVVIAMALACEPDMIIADEPTTALDVTIQAQILAMMQELRKRIQTSMILITHDLGIVAKMCDKVAVMYAGELIECGTVEDVFSETNPHHPYTVGLFNSIPDLHKKSKRLNPIPGLMPDPTALPDGCCFAQRCPQCFARCEKNKPTNSENGTHKILCHLYNGKGSK